MLIEKVPESFKSAAVAPLLKKNNLDQNCFKKVRPESNLFFISKILEKVVAARINHHKDSNNLTEVLQSADCKNHSCETELLRIHNDLLQQLDDKRC